MLTKQVLLDVGGFDENMPAMQDYDLWIRVCQKVEVGMISEPKVLYYNYTDQQQISLNTSKYKEARKKIEEKYDSLFAKLNEKEIKRINIRSSLNMSERCLRNNQKEEALKYIKESLGFGFNIKALIYLCVLGMPYGFILKLRSLLFN